MDAAKADCDDQALGLGGYCHDLFFALPLSAATRDANSIATLELMALVACCFHCDLPFLLSPLPARRSRVRLPLCYLPPRG
eukprot:3282070-Pleurochrysis_carterae.AAC.1